MYKQPNTAEFSVEKQKLDSLRDPVFRSLRRSVNDHHVADEAVQLAFVKFIEKFGYAGIQRFPGATLMAYLVRIAFCEAMNIFRDLNKSSSANFQDVILFEHDATQPIDEAMTFEEEAKRLYEEFSTRHPELVEATMLRYRGRSYREIREELGFSLSSRTIRNRMVEFRDLVIAREGNPLEK